MIKIYEEKPKDKDIFLKLEQNGDRIEVIVVNKNGYPEESGTLCYIDDKGITICCAVDEFIPINKDNEGRLQVSYE